MRKLTRLFEPVKIGSMELCNRFIMPALTTFYDLEGGTRFSDFYVERVKGGVSLVVIGALQALYPGRAGQSGWVPDESVAEKGIAKINHDLYIPRLKKWTDAIHDAGGKACAQIAVYGYWAKGGYGAPAEEISASGVRLEGEAYRPDLETLTFIRGGRPLAAEEIHQIEDEVAEAAVRAKKAGFDAIQLQSLGGNLLSRFLSPLTNKRTDAYGGSLRNRARMTLETIAKIKKRVGDDFPLISRINGDDLLPGGMKIEDYKQLAPMLEEAGVHAIDIYPSWYESRQPLVQMCVPPAAFSYISEGLKRVLKIPVAANVRINDPVIAEQLLADGKADLISMCGPLIADPELPNKAREGRLDDIRRCTACCACWSEIAEFHRPLVCSVNARAGKESRYVIRPADRPKRVWVVGGGPAGMEAARVASLRGHQVTLFEKGDHLGGQLLYAVLPPHKEEWNRLTDYLTGQLRKLNVDVKLNEEVTAEKIDHGKPDAVIVATGASPLIPGIPGVRGKTVATALEVLAGHKRVGSTVVVVGGGSIGCETAEFLVEQGKKVALLEMLPRMGNDVDLWNRWILLDRLKSLGIRMEVETRVEEITDNGVRAVRQGKTEFFPADTVVVAVGMKPENNLAQQLEGKGTTFVKVGDCVKPQKVKGAVDSGFQAGMTV